MCKKTFLRRLVRSSLPVLALATGLGLSPAHAQSLQEALSQAYQSNPTLESQRAALRATDELVPQARSGFLPTLSAEGDIGRNRQEQDEAISAWTEKSVGVTLTQPVYRGGQTVAAVDRAEALVQAQRASLASTEQDVLLSAATAYLDVVRDQAVRQLNINNEQVLRRQLEASNDRFRVGEITRTDVSQSEARLSGAISSRIQAEGQLSASRATFTRLIGTVPGQLVQPKTNFVLPASQDEAVSLAEQNNPSVIAARFNERAASAAVDQVTGELLPSVNIVGSYQRIWDRPTANGAIDSGSLTARLTVPIYEAGATTSRVREAKQTVGQRRNQVDEAVRQARSTAVSAWEALVTARATIESNQAQVRSSEIALEGVRQEATVGSRTVLDVLNAEQELLDARVNLVTAQRDEVVAVFQLLSATGQLTAGRLDLGVTTYNYEDHYNKVRGKIWGVSAD
ncbi:TolC family outer membrane protein [Oleisolibacter albus]|uniref:TolC family outer membrane protein n=1 Tax=Oleisolibacter albus TaxID=2171757 RepID=UPI001875166E|nr:TolC family outer membrane protein [Oleisolibacter albus]